MPRGEVVYELLKCSKCGRVYPRTEIVEAKMKKFRKGLPRDEVLLPCPCGQVCKLTAVKTQDKT